METFTLVEHKMKEGGLFQMTALVGLQVCESFWNGFLNRNGSVKRMGAESGCLITVAFWVGVGSPVRAKLWGKAGPPRIFLVRLNESFKAVPKPKP
jgi:hypothetical protein